MSNADWPGTPGFPALGARAAFTRKSLQLPFATLNGESDAPEIIWGTVASPEGAVVGSPGDVYVPVVDNDISVWKKKTGNETNTGWVQIAASAQVGGGGGGGGSAGSGVGFLPTSPFIGHVLTPGAASTPPFIHLFNPSASGILLTIYELWVVNASSGAIGIRARRTATPLSLHGGGETIVAASPLRLDEQNVVGVISEFAGTNVPASTFTEASAQWSTKLGAEGGGAVQPTPVRPPLAFPWIVKPGSALEVEGDTNGTTSKLRVIAVWDEVAIPA